MEKFFWVLCILGCLLGAVFFLDALVSAQSATPQQAAFAALAGASAILRYCLARTVEKLKKE